MTGETVADRLASLARDHNRRMSDIDPRVAPAPPLDDNAVVSSSGPGALAAGSFRNQCYDESAFEALWGALCRHVVRIHVSGQNPAPAFGDVLAGLLDRIQAAPGHTEDRAVVVTWPSMDTVCAAPLVRHGFAPLTVLAVNELRAHVDPRTSATVRRAERGDLDELTNQACRLHQFEMGLGALPDRSDLRARLRAELADTFDSEVDLILVAVVNGALVGFVHGQLPHGAWIERQIVPGPAGYLSRLFVEPAARRSSVGRGLVAAAHEVLRESGAEVALLHHSLHNPLATPMWGRLGYQPVLTTWTLSRPFPAHGVTVS